MKYLIISVLFLIPGLVLAGTAPPSATQILAQAKAASGGAAWDHIHSKRRVGTIKVGGLSGTITSLKDLRTGRSVLHYKLGPISGARGFNGKVSWSKTPNGDISTKDTPAAKKQTATFAYQAEQAWWYPERWPAKIESLGTKRDNAKTFQVLKITPHGGDSFEVWINAKTHLIARFVYHTPARSTLYFSDYRTVHGVKIPFHERSTSHDQIEQWEKIAVNVPVSDADFAIPGQHLNNVSFIAGGDVATIPFKFVDTHIYIPVKINGHSLHFILDSGSFNVLSPRAAKAVGVRAKGTFRANGMGAKTVGMRLSRVNSVVLGGKVALRKQVFYVIPLPSDSYARLDGTVGYGLFKHFVVRIDYAKHLLTLIRPSAFDPKHAGIPVPLDFNGRQATVKGSIDGIPGQFLLDTGNNGSLDLHASFAKAHDLYARYDATPSVITGYGIGGVTRGRVARGGKLTIGPVTVNDPVITLSTATHGTVAGRNLDGNIGARILDRFTVTFDYPDQVMYLKPNKNRDEPMNYDRSGMAFKQTKQGLPVVGVMKGGPAAQAGIKVGDIITAVNGKPADKLTRLTFSAMLRNEAPGTKVKLAIGEGKAAHSVTITLRRLIPKTGGLASSAPAQGPKIVNIMPAFWEFEAQTGKHMSTSARDDLFRKLVIAPYSNIYDKSEFKHDLTHKGIKHYLAWVKPYLPLMRKLSHQVKAEIRPALDNFLDEFPDFNGSKLTVVFMPSLQQFVGQTGKLENGDEAMMFGLDRMARYPDKHIVLPVVFTHELFHAYHHQVNPALFNHPPMFAQLWIEGLATYVSQQLNPGTSEATALAGPKLASADPAFVAEAARQFLAVFASTAPAEHNKFFYSGYKGKLLPLSGYLLGYLVCKQLAKQYSLQEMAHLHGKQLETLIHAAMVSLANKNSPTQKEATQHAP